MVEVKQHTRNIKGKKCLVKQYSRKEPVMSAKDYNKKNSVKAPYENESGKMSIQFSINVPSTTNHDEEVSTKEFKRRVNETEEFLSRTFGGKTSIKGSGGYMEGDKLINEGIVRVESSMSKKSYKDNKDKLEKFIKSKKQEWKQDSIGYNFEDEFFMYPKQKWMKDYNVIDN